MAKELPYFKFEPNAWDNGNIQMLSREEKGLFIDICSMYWSRLGDIPLKLVIQKLCAGNATALKSLCDEKIIEVIDGNIFIKFLSEQLNEFEDVSKQNSKNAKEGWEKRRRQKEESERNATALKSQRENDAIREDKIKEEEIKEEKKIEDILLKKETKKSLLSEICISDLEFNEVQYFEIALAYQKLFIKNLKEKNAPFASQEKATYKNYVTPIRLMMNSDGVTKEQITKVYKYLGSIEGEFWKSNILSTSKLREKFQQLLLKSQENGKSGTTKSTGNTNAEQKQSAVDAVNALYGR